MHDAGADGGSDAPPDGTIPAPSLSQLNRRGGAIRPVLVIGCLAMAMLAGLTVMIILELRARELLAARHQLMAFDTLLAEQTERAVQGVDLVVNEVADELQMSGVTTAAAFDRLAGDPQLYQRLRQKIANIPQLDAITLDSADGNLISFSRYYPIPQVSIADRPYFQAMRDDPSRKTMISEPVRNRGDGNWNIYLAHRISGPHGAFVGLVLGAMRVDYFEGLYETLSIAGGTSIGLWRQDGTLLAHFPRAEAALGQRSAAKAHFSRMAPGETSVAVDRSDVDGVPRMIASHLLTREAIVVDASQTLDAVLSDFRHDEVVIGVSGFVCTVAAGLLVWALVRQFTAYEAMARAVAAREEAVQARQVAEERLLVAQKMEAIGRITSGVAHDFNNLLTSIIANAELLQRAAGTGGAGTGSTDAKRLSTILQASDRGAALVRQLLAFSRQQVLAPARVETGAVLEGMTDLLESALGAEHAVRLRIADGVWPTLVDPVQFENMVLNLAINARDAQAGGGEVTIVAENFPADHADRPEDLAPGEYVTVSVIDTGTGMTEEVLRNVFEPFFTTKPIGRGSGLGLSQVYGVARQSGGTVRIRSTLGVGTTVQVFLPRADPGIAQASAPAAAADGAGRVVLLVDDDAPVRETLAAALTEAGFSVVAAADGAAALARMADGLEVDVLLVDRHMPGLDGLAVAAAARARRPGVAVVFMTGDEEEMVGERWVIQKPFLAGAVTGLLQRALIQV